MTACGGGGGERTATTTTITTTTGVATSSTSAPGPTEPGAATALSETATCEEFLAARRPARENATRAALIVFRQGAGVEREPSPAVRAEFEKAVDEVCRARRTAGMLDVMSAVATVSQGTYLR